MVHNVTASTVNLAKAMLFDLDRSKLDTPVRTATLELLLNTLVELGLGTPTASQIEAQQAGLVNARITGLERR